MQLVITVEDGATNTEMAQALRFQAGLLEGLPPKTASARKNTASPASSKASAAPSDDDDTDFVTETAADTNGFDDDAPDDVPTRQEKEHKAAKGKTAKPKKITLDDVNDACKAHAQAKGRPATLDVLQKRFKTQSVTALKPEQYEACISAMAVN